MVTNAGQGGGRTGGGGRSVLRVDAARSGDEGVYQCRGAGDGGVGQGHSIVKLGGEWGSSRMGSHIFYVVLLT